MLVRDVRSRQRGPMICAALAAFAFGAARPQSLLAPEAVAAPREQTVEPARTAVRVGEYAAAPWVDQDGGPRGSGYIMEGRDLPAIRSKDQSRMNLYDRVVLAPPVGAVAPEHQLYLS